MKRILVVVDGSVQAHLALDQALEFAGILPSAEVILLHVPRPLPPWKAHRPNHPPSETDISKRVVSLALARAATAGVTARCRIEPGGIAEVAARIASEECCDHIFLAKQDPTPVARALMAFTGFTANTAANQILSLSSLPVTVVGHERRDEI